MEGKESEDWKLVDVIVIIVHLFHPEKRNFYDLEKCGRNQYQKKMI